jgi:hypothetical protein
MAAARDLGSSGHEIADRCEGGEGTARSWAGADMKPATRHEADAGAVARGSSQRQNISISWIESGPEEPNMALLMGHGPAPRSPASLRANFRRSQIASSHASGTWREEVSMLSSSPISIGPPRKSGSRHWLSRKPCRGWAPVRY